jgi:hypothetical protein
MHEDTVASLVQGGSVGQKDCVCWRDGLQCLGMDLLDRAVTGWLIPKGFTSSDNVY